MNIYSTKKLTLENFIQKANQKHNFKFDYSNSIYVNSKTYIEIICPIHSSFLITPNNHLSGIGCSACAKKKKLTKEKFIFTANTIHQSKFDYSKIKFKNSKQPVEIICPIHNSFWQSPYLHIKGQGCAHCSKTKSHAQFIIEANIKHNYKYSYSLSNYIHSTSTVTIICPFHGQFDQTPHNHLEGHGCKTCYLESITSNQQNFINLMNQKHNFKYDYSKVLYSGARFKINIICPKHGDFTQLASSHAQGNGCPLCKESSGEKIIRTFLKNNNIEFQAQYRIKKCVYQRTLPFDFAIFKNNNLIGLIEFQGRQHYSPIKIWPKTLQEFQISQLRDQIKVNYCNNNNIPLLIIACWKKKNINNLLSTFLYDISVRSLPTCVL
jgi:hypothetical protein